MQTLDSKRDPAATRHSVGRLVRLPVVGTLAKLILWPRNIIRHADWLARALNEETAARLVAEDEVDRLTRSLSSIRELVDRQAEDDGLWFAAQTAPEAYLQQELRKLHALIESFSPNTKVMEGGD